MCGLTMVVTNNRNGFNKQQQDVFSTLFYLAGGFRGRDGAGVTVIDNKGNVSIAKDAISVDRMLCTKEYDELDSKAYQNGWVMMGHNRSATRGVVSDKNAHPFIIDDKIVIMHNGTFYGDHKHLKDTEVDSEAIGHVLLEEDNIKTALGKIHAAYALLWYNVEAKKLHAVRNASRPLFYARTDDMHMFSSEKVFLSFVADKFNLKLIEAPYECREHCLTTFTLQKKGGHDIEVSDIEIPTFQNQQYSSTWATSKSTFDRCVLDKLEQDFPEIFVKTDWPTYNKTLSEKYKYNLEFNVFPESYFPYKEGDKECFAVVGKVLDEEEIGVVFLMENIDEAHMKNIMGNSIFHVTSKGPYWRKDPECTGNKMEEWTGQMLIHAGKPVVVPMTQSANG